MTAMRKLSISLISTILFSLFIQAKANAQCCEYTLSTYDSYGDGWNGATLEILVNTVSQGLFLASGNTTSFAIPVCDADVIELIYTPGDYENENSYILQDASWNVLFADGPDPDTGNVFQTLGNCNTPLLEGSHPCTAIPMNAGDCVMANNTGFPGSGLNPNCSNFNGGDIWYVMEVPASGNLSFTTSMGGLDDTVIAIWSGESCNNPNVIGCDDDSGDGYYSFLLSYDLTPGEIIYIQVYGYGGALGAFQLCSEDIGTVNLESSELPIVMINTLEQTIIQDTKIDCLMDIKYNGPGNLTSINDPANIYSGNIGIEIRGLTSAGYPQHPYGIETRDAAGLNNNVSILGMPAENDWVLLSNFNDRTLLKNLMAFKLFGEMDNYSIRAQLCEVLIDSSYKGIYVIGEKVKRDANRVNIANLLPTDIAGDSLTGGYILQQNYWNENNSFLSNFSPIDHPGFDVHFVYEYPKAEDIQEEQKLYIASYIDSLETALYSEDFTNPETGYRKYMNIESFIDYFLVNELARSADGFKKSVFFHKDKYSNGGKLNAGPVWDFDWGWKNMSGVCEIYEGYDGAGWAHQNNDCFTDNYSTGWYIRLLQDESFRDELRCTYEGYRETMLDTVSLFAYIDSMGALVMNAQDRHFQKWPILGVSGPAPDYGIVAETYYDELDSLKSWISKRIIWLDENIPGLCSPIGVDEISNSNISEVKCYPNPATNEFTISYSLNSPNKVIIKLCDALGKEVMSSEEGMRAAGQHSVQIDTSGIEPGLYMVTMIQGEAASTARLVIGSKL
jgi:hypothetical protein